jgi:hypothetical protein
MVHDADGSVLGVGRRTRTPSPALRRAVRERDQYRCRFPGCESRRVDLHHIRHWANGGPTSQHNMLCHCRRHHKIVHDKGYIITASGQFHTRDGKPIPHSPSLPRGAGDITTTHEAEVADHTIIPPTPASGSTSLRHLCLPRQRRERGPPPATSSGRVALGVCGG